MHSAALDSYRRRIIHTLSHEFRTPLVSVNTGTELLLEQNGHFDNEHTRRLLVCIRRGGQRLQKLVDDFMLLQQIDWGHAASMCDRFRQPVPIDKLLETAIEVFVAAGDEGTRPKIDIAFETQSNVIPYADIYDIQIIDVIQRILSNAAKFAGADKPVSVKVTADPMTVQILFRDFGPGLSPERLKEACEIFSQIGREKLEQQGCGLGLTIAKYFAELNGGSIYFQKPATGDGLEVQLKLKRANSDF